MLGAKETETILERLFGECLRYWEGQTQDERKSFELAIQDVEGVTHDPYSPQGDELDAKTKRKFLKYRKMDLGK